ncbi:hypothetical protein J5N97_009220 [Dioscorea zingiberensis]|uniref:Hexosyltransferase n=1 Tax=Dioscorea zingiberensis TaxID=325984 RepID=A0A9D5CZ13_9LILI|nr:hypothetical protein J5N97_009220 [Dioscorea zingiberensis]
MVNLDAAGGSVALGRTDEPKQWATLDCGGTCVCCLGERARPRALRTSRDAAAGGTAIWEIWRSLSFRACLSSEISFAIAWTCPFECSATAGGASSLGGASEWSDVSKRSNPGTERERDKEVTGSSLSSPSPPSPHPASTSPSFSILIVVFTRTDLYERCHFLLLIYNTQSSLSASIHLNFIFCNLTKPEQRILFALEIRRFEDIIILNCSENMNSGKTYTFFSSLLRILPHPYDYVMKSDDDVFLRFSSLAASLLPLPRHDL